VQLIHYVFHLFARYPELDYTYHKNGFEFGFSGSLGSKGSLMEQINDSFVVICSAVWYTSVCVKLHINVRVKFISSKDTRLLNDQSILCIAAQENFTQHCAAGRAEKWDSSCVSSVHNLRHVCGGLHVLFHRTHFHTSIVGHFDAECDFYQQQWFGCNFGHFDEQVYNFIETFLQKKLWLNIGSFFVEKWKKYLANFIMESGWKQHQWRVVW